ncbi:hypothetical protein DBR32_10445 [Taibaiella sp. KBW10]|uniref:T9SS type A sorting domain-containing protein n=1 Tax=Taibaiella sp. KBW10 TaxID=2153357 RepID=UPI000F5A8A15|nr:T9SS type A sorting domain-containing protein [Taibaiella sp. KBW10]RQO31114.1 hypothetical protein DBR32_10445 [Taibaiella sp. KBW10]
MLKSLKKLVIPLSLLIAGSDTISAQVFTTPLASEFIYAPFGVKKPTGTANYSMKNVNTGFGLTDLYLSAWNSNLPGTAGEFIYHFTNPSNPTSTVSQGAFQYPDATDINVGIVWDGNISDYVVLVSYYSFSMGGHYLDIYNMTGSPGSPLSLGTTINLSSSSTYGRIRMDSHKLYGVAITWDYPGIGIQTMVGNAGNWSGITTLSGTKKYSGPDVAFSHSSGPLNVHFVYKNPPTGTIIESVLDWNVLLAVPFGSTATMTALVEDVNSGPASISDLVLDCPDHYDVENWAYSYTDGSRIYVRHMDYHSASAPATVIVNNGSLGNAATDRRYKATAPALHYGDGGAGGTTGQITVGWYTTGGIGSQYIALEMKESGTSLISAPDYMRLPNSLNSFSYPVSAIAFSKISDGQGGLAPDFLYATYFTEKSSGSSNYLLHHAFHKWNNPVFRGGGSTPPQFHADCGKHASQYVAAAVQTVAYPNPFHAAFTNTVTMNEQGLVQLSLTDVTGRMVAQRTVTLPKGYHLVKMDGLDQLNAGTYFLTTTINGQKNSTQVIAKQ